MAVNRSSLSLEHPLPISLLRIRTYVLSFLMQGAAALVGRTGKGNDVPLVTMEGTVGRDKGPVEEKVKDTVPKKQKRG